MTIFYAYSLAVIAYSYVRIHKGLESTFLTRKAIVTDTFRVVFAYLLYVAVLLVLYIIMASFTHNPNNTNKADNEFYLSMANATEKITAYFVACR